MMENQRDKKQYQEAKQLRRKQRKKKCDMI